MVDPRDILLPPLAAAQAHFATIAKAPADLNDLVAVIIPDFDESLEWGPCRWQSRDATSLPAKGDDCLVIFDNRMQPWIVSWWPF